jgi:hypothetical protein
MKIFLSLLVLVFALEAEAQTKMSVKGKINFETKESLERAIWFDGQLHAYATRRTFGKGGYEISYYDLKTNRRIRKFRSTGEYPPAVFRSILVDVEKTGQDRFLGRVFDVQANKILCKIPTKSAWMASHLDLTQKSLLVMHSDGELSRYDLGKSETVGGVKVCKKEYGFSQLDEDHVFEKPQAKEEKNAYAPGLRASADLKYISLKLCPKSSGDKTKCERAWIDLGAKAKLSNIPGDANLVLFSDGNKYSFLAWPKESSTRAMFYRLEHGKVAESELRLPVETKSSSCETCCGPSLFFLNNTMLADYGGKPDAAILVNVEQGRVLKDWTFAEGSACVNEDWVQTVEGGRAKAVIEGSETTLLHADAEGRVNLYDYQSGAKLRTVTEIKNSVVSADRKQIFSPMKAGIQVIEIVTGAATYFDLKAKIEKVLAEAGGKYALAISQKKPGSYNLYLLGIEAK